MLPGMPTVVVDHQVTRGWLMMAPGRVQCSAATARAPGQSAGACTQKCVFGRLLAPWCLETSSPHLQWIFFLSTSLFNPTAAPV